MRPVAARQVLPAADQPGPDQHATRGADGEQEGVQEASQPGRSDHDLVWAEGGGVHTRLRLKISCLPRARDSHALSLSTFVDMNQSRDVREGLCMFFRCRNFIQRSNLERYPVFAPSPPYQLATRLCASQKIRIILAWSEYVFSFPFLIFLASI